ncbi:MAG TPA: hypothetical protein VJ763_02775 [Sphingomicrobium sp.]|nr:hypothetical protein [Sphingomicrobium sp.]
MTDRERNRRENDARQSSEIDEGLGQDERAFGAGGQKVQWPLSNNDKPNRDTGRDPTVPSEPAQRDSVGSLTKEK